jgi:hypothetical protein
MKHPEVKVPAKVRCPEFRTHANSLAPDSSSISKGASGIIKK